MPKITAVTQQKRNPNRWSVFVDGEFLAGCNERTLSDLGIRVGAVLTEGEIAELRQSFGIATIRQRALDYLSRRGRSIKEMRDYLHRRGFEEEQIVSTIDWLIERNYLDDRRFAADWIRGRMNTAPRGRQRLLAELYQKGISREIAEDALSRSVTREEEIEAAWRAVTSRQSRWEGLEPLEIKRKIYNFLSYRGFSPDAVRAVWERLKNEGVDVKERQ